jgi:hypothetical protein
MPTPAIPLPSLISDRWLPGLQPGDLAASELNPLVFRR